MNATPDLTFSYTRANDDPREQPEFAGIRQLEFSGIHPFGDVFIRIIVCANVDTSAIDTSAGDVQTTSVVEKVDFEVSGGDSLYGDLLFSLSIFRAGCKEFDAVSPRVHLNDYEEKIDRCHELAAVLFKNGLVATWFADGSAKAAS